MVELDSVPITSNLNGHFELLLQILEDETQVTSSGSLLRAYISALKGGVDVPCPQCFPFGNMDPFCEICGGAGTLPIVRFVSLEPELSNPLQDGNGQEHGGYI